MSILFYENLEDLRLKTGLSRVEKEPDFHIFKFSDLTDAKNFMPPYRRGFYQLTLIQNFGESTMKINTHNFVNHKDILYFVGPEHILSWYRDRTVKGFIIYFKSSFLELSNEQLDQQFTYFNPYKKNLIELEDEDLSLFRNYFEVLFQEQNQAKPKYRRQILGSQLTAFLYHCQEIYEEKIAKESETTQPLSTLFKRYVENHYMTLKSVKEFANLMHLSSNHLSQMVK